MGKIFEMIDKNRFECTNLCKLGRRWFGKSPSTVHSGRIYFLIFIYDKNIVTQECTPVEH